MNAPTCVWNPVDRRPLQLENRQQWWRPAQMSGDRAERPSSQGRDAADMMDSFRMNLRQAKHALTMRDEEARKLRLAVTHLEGVVSLRERELRDTVLCLQGKSLPRPHQEWLQAGTSNSRLRLQVHRLQRAVTAKQDHIEHLKRQASLGFLCEAREQADEYRMEAARLSRALAAATGGVGRLGDLFTSTPVDRPSSSPSRGAGGTMTSVGVREEEYKNQGVPASQSPIPADATYPRVSPFRPRTTVSSAVGCGGRGDAQEQQRILDESNGRRKPSLAWGAAAAVHAYLGRQGAVRRREVHPEPHWSPPFAVRSALDGIGMGPLSVPPPIGDDDEEHGLLRSGRRPPSPQRSTGRASARFGRGRSRGWNRSPDRCRAFSEEKRLSCMAASARLRAAVRQSAVEHREVLALSEESRRLHVARAERARRARVVQQKIARYREERIHELERRLERRCGTRPADIPPAANTAMLPEAQHRDESNNSTGRHGQEQDTGDEDTNTSGVVFTSSNDRLQRLSEERREIDAAIATAIKENYEPASAHHEPPGLARRKRKESQEQDRGGRQRRWQSASSRADSILAEEESFGRDVHEETHNVRTSPSRKPPLAPSHAGGRRRPQSAVRRRSSVSEVSETVVGGSSGEDVGGDYAWSAEDCDHDVDEVQTEAMGNGGDIGTDDGWRNQRLSDGEESVFEESVLSRGWGEDKDRGAPRDGEPPTLSRVGKVRIRSALSHDDKRRRHRPWVTSGSLGDDKTSAANVRRSSEESVPASDARSEVAEVAEVADEGDVGRAGRRHLATRKNRPMPGGRDQKSSSTIAQPKLHAEDPARGGFSGRKTGSWARERDLRGSTGASDDAQPGSTGASDEAAANNLRSRGRRRRRRNETGRVPVDDDRLTDPIPSLGRSGQPISSAAASGVREEGNSVHGGVEDDGGSCSSRWSLSAEDGPQENKRADNASLTRQAHHGVGDGSEGGFAAGTTSPEREGDGHGRGRKVPIDPASEEGVHMNSNGHATAGTGPEYADDFSEEPRGRNQRHDHSYAVSSPSDEEYGSFGAAEEDPDPAYGIDGDQGRQDQPHFNTNTESNQMLIGESPYEPGLTDAGQDDSSSVNNLGRPGYPQPGNDNSADNQVLLQPVSPPALRQSAQASEFGADPPKISLPGREKESGRPQPLVTGKTSTEADSNAELNDRSGLNSPGQASSPRCSALPGVGQTGEDTGSEADDVVGPIKIDSAALFASLSASTAGATLSSKSMARVEESGASRAAAARPPVGSTSTFALSTDDDDDAGATRGKNEGNGAVQSSSSRLNAKRPLDTERESVGGDSSGVGGNAAIVGDDPTPREPVGSSTSVPPTSSLKSGHGGSTSFSEATHRQAPSSSGREQQTPSSKGNPSGVSNSHLDSMPTEQPLIPVKSSGSGASRSMIGDEAKPLPNGEEEGQLQGQDRLNPKSDPRNPDENEGGSVGPLKDRPSRGEGNGDGFGEDVESQAASWRDGEDHVSGDHEGGDAVAALERQPSRGGDSSNSSLLDVGGGGVDGDDDDGYF